MFHNLQILRHRYCTIYALTSLLIDRNTVLKNVSTSLHSSHYLYCQISGITYVPANVERGCCVSNTQYHRKCQCDDIFDQIQCQSLCSSDNGCRGYALYSYCQFATTSSCPAVCRGPYDVTNTGKIDPNGDCSSSNVPWLVGCQIKTGMLLRENLVSNFITSSFYRLINYEIKGRCYKIGN